MININSSLLASLLLSASLIGGCSDGGSSSNKARDNSTSSFEFTVTNPADGELASNVFSRSTKQLLGMFIPEAQASLGDQNIQVAIVDYNGVVTQLVTPIEPLKQEANGTYVVILEGGVRLDCVLLVTLDGPSDIKIGDRIDESGALYTPTVDASEPLDIDLASTIAFDLFIDEVESFENITPSEVDRLIEGAQKIINESGITAVDTETLAELISAELASYVKTETLLAASSDESASGEQGSTGTIEGDRAKIKGFFDDVNTLAVVLPGKYEAALESDSAFEKLKTDTDAAQAIIEGADNTLDDLASLQASLQSGLEGFQLGSTDLSIATIFANDPKANLTGMVSLSDTAASFTLNGTYGTLTQVNLNITANFSSTTNTPFSFTIAGKVASPDATVELKDGLIELHSSEAVSASLIAQDQTQAQEEAASAELEEKLNAANAELTIQLTVHKDSQDLSHFTGTFTIEAVRSSKDYIEFAGDDARAFYNLKSMSLDGRFTLGESHIAAKAFVKQNNAENYTPLTQELLEDTVYNNLYSYDYNGTNEFVFHTPDYVQTVTADLVHEYKVLNIASYINDYEYNTYSESFTSFIQDNSDLIFADNAGEYTYLGGSNLEKGENKSVIQDGFTFTYTFTDTSLTVRSDKNGYGSQRFASYEYASSTDGYISINVRKYTSDSHMHMSSFEEYMNGHYGWSFQTDLTNGSGSAEYFFNYKDVIKGTGTLEAELQYAYSYDSYTDVTDSQPQTFIVDYIYNDDGFKTTNLNNNIEILFLGIEEYTGLNITSQYKFPGASSIDGFDQYLSYSSSKGSFSDYLNSRYFGGENSYNWYRSESVGDVTLNFSELALTTGDSNAIPAEITYVTSLEDYENATNFRAYSYGVELDTDLEGIGATLIKANLERTGNANGVITLTLSHTDENSLLADVNILAAINNGEVGSVNITNSDGFVISRDDLEESDEELKLTFGLETATVIATDTGIKVTYSDGSFDLY